MKHTAEGIPEFNLQSLEPLIIPELKLEQGTEVVNYKITLTNLKIFDISKANIRDATINLDTLKDLQIKLDLDTLYVEGDYDLNGRALILPVKGHGVLKSNLTNSKVVLNFMADPILKKKGTYVEIKNTAAEIKIGKATADFSNLFNGDPLLGPATNKFLNENANEIIGELAPAINQIIEKIFQEIINKLFRTQPIESFFPES